MLRKIFNIVVILPLAILFVAFAVANRHMVTVSFNPFDSSDPGLSLSLPLFVVIVAVAMVGVIAGGVATWFGQRRWRRAARHHEAEARQARAELADMRTRLPAPGAVPASGQGLDAALVPQYPAIGRDKTGAAL